MKNEALVLDMIKFPLLKNAKLCWNWPRGLETEENFKFKTLQIEYWCQTDDQKSSSSSCLGELRHISIYQL